MGRCSHHTVKSEYVVIVGLYSSALEPQNTVSHKRTTLVRVRHTFAEQQFRPTTTTTALFPVFFELDTEPLSFGFFWCQPEELQGPRLSYGDSTSLASPDTNQRFIEQIQSCQNCYHPFTKMRTLMMPFSPC